MSAVRGSQFDQVWERQKTFIPGGFFSLNRKIEPMRVFIKAKGAYIWDHDGKQYIDYHGAFSPYFLGHCDPDVDEAVVESIRRAHSLIGAGTTPWEGELAEILVECVPTLEQVQVTNTGSEATFLALRVARAVTGRDKIVIVQGGYNGWHDDVAFNLMDPVDDSYKVGQEVPLNPISAGIPQSKYQDVHVMQFNDLVAAEHLLRTENIAAIILEPILQNVGLIKPQPGYLEGLRKLCDECETLLIFDEVKTGFRHALGGYQSICGVTPDLSTFGKAIANGYPIGVIGGKRRYMEYFNHSDPQRRVMIAGTYNGHPVPVAAAIATLRKLRDRQEEIYGHTNALGKQMEEGLSSLLSGRTYSTVIVRQGSAFVVYFMKEAPQTWLDIARNNDMKMDGKYRKLLIERGIFHFPVPTKQGSISFAHTQKDIDETLLMTEKVIEELQ